MVQFNDEVARMLDDAYDGRDATQRRIATLAQMNHSGGETIVDLGCGAGHLTVEAARAVGPEGRVIAIDPAAAMLKKAADRCSGRQNVTVQNATAEETGLADNSVDGVAAIQVFSYLSDLAPALVEARRILKPNGKLVICDIHWGGAIWAATNRDLGRRIVDFWAGQLKTPDVPEKLTNLAKNAGFTSCEVVAVPVVDKDLRPDGLARMLMTLIEKSAENSDPDLFEEIQKWREDQFARAQENRFFFSVTNFVSVLY